MIDEQEDFDASQAVDAAVNWDSPLPKVSAAEEFKLDEEQVAPATETPAPGPVLYKFTNAAESPYLDSLLAMVYQGAFDNSLGIMECWDLSTDDVAVVIVGVQLDENGKAECYPLFKLLKAEDVPNFLSPDGNGGYYDPADPAAVADAKDNMKSYNEAIVE